MINIQIDAETPMGVIQQIQRYIGGSITERWGEYILEVDNDKAKGSIRLITFDWGVSLFDFDIIYIQETVMTTYSKNFNPIRFIYTSEGYCGQKYSHQDESDIKIMEQFQSIIITSRENEDMNYYFPQNKRLVINVIQIMRKPFLKNRLNQGEELNKQLYRVFMDTDHEHIFQYYGSYNLKMADKIAALKKVRTKGMIRIMQIEGLMYQILCMHMLAHDKDVKNKTPNTSLLKRELKIIRGYAKKIEKNIAHNFSLEDIAAETGLTQAKLQEGFKLLYNKTVTEYIRHARLETARDLINNTELSISEIVYSIGFSSRSYFSKIFKDKYGLSPSEFKNNEREAQELAL